MADGPRDINTKLLVYLRTLYGVTNGDVTTLIRRYLNTGAGAPDATKQMQALIVAAKDS